MEQNKISRFHAVVIAVSLLLIALFIGGCNVVNKNKSSQKKTVDSVFNQSKDSGRVVKSDSNHTVKKDSSSVNESTNNDEVKLEFEPEDTATATGPIVIVNDNGKELSMYFALGIGLGLDKLAQLIKNASSVLQVNRKKAGI
jgi:hypothetical protein